jgi:hypothetical protein
MRRGTQNGRPFWVHDNIVKNRLGAELSLSVLKHFLNATDLKPHQAQFKSVRKHINPVQTSFNTCSRKNGQLNRIIQKMKVQTIGEKIYLQHIYCNIFDPPQ